MDLRKTIVAMGLMSGCSPDQLRWTDHTCSPTMQSIQQKMKNGNETRRKALIKYSMDNRVNFVEEFEFMR